MTALYLTQQVPPRLTRDETHLIPRERKFTLAALLEGQGSLSATHAGNVLFVLGSVCFVRDGLRVSAARQAQSTRGENGGACTHSPGLVQP